jgi:acyl-CoA thioesterase-2
MKLVEILDLEHHGPDTYVGTGPQYPWGGLYGGQIVAQAVRAASLTVHDGFEVHSLRAYFIRRGDHNEPVRYEVDRLRNGRSFCTRRVVARQATGAILNLEASFQRHEQSADVETVAMPLDLPGPESLEPTSWSSVFERRFLPRRGAPGPDHVGAGRTTAWVKVHETLDDDPLLQASALTYLSDDLPTDAVVRAHPVGREPEDVIMASIYTASLDHTIWFHRPVRADAWHLHEFTCHTFVGGRGLSIGHVFTEDGIHAATIAQEVLLRDVRDRKG